MASQAIPKFGSIVSTLEGKTILITGCTGFLGKCLLEKLLRTIPVKRIYVLVRGRKGSTASERVDKEIMGSEIFDRLRKERKGDFDDYFRSKVVGISGDVTQNDCGFSKKDILMLQDELEIIFHCAAIVDFNERIDRAVEMNVMGSVRMFEIAQRCRKLGLFLHVSTAYVNSNRSGWINEKLYPLGFDADKIIDQIRQLKKGEMERFAVSELLRDWPNTYTFTKAMTEDILVRRRGTVPLAIVRPSIIGSAWKEPFPGWVDAISAAGTVYIAVGLGVLKFLPGAPSLIADLIPVDVVVNTMLSCVPSQYNQDKYQIYHAASSAEHPLHWGLPLTHVLSYFKTHPVNGAVSKPEFHFTESPQEYQLLLFLRYSVVSSIFKTLAPLGPKGFQKRANQFNKLVWRVRVITESFRHFTESEWQFDNRNTRALWQNLSQDERDLFSTTLADLDWTQYNLHYAYGLQRYCMKTDMVELGPDDMTQFTNIIGEQWSNRKKNLLERTFYDISWTTRQASERKGFPSGRSLDEIRSLVLTSPAVQAAINAEVKAQSKLTLAEVEERARGIADKMFGDASLPVMTGMAWFFRKIWRRLYKEVRVNLAGLQAVREAATKGPLIFIPKIGRAVQQECRDRSRMPSSA
eukprot:TRINITY_DN4214_c0_g1_i19.p1 TRINITY_DN4214_c0_g1~~TRINITY_DN4214_c0_g1_i19.p1  ORF type:complete len:635 (-),score=53.32 TRINITY_DN4214_c0_g1_i19:12-1916(-)